MHWAYNCTSSGKNLSPPDLAMGEPHFAASRMKLVRAKGFVSELEAERLRYMRDDPLSGYIDRSTPEHFIQVDWKPIGLLPGAIIGDAIHNARTALDLMVSEMATLMGRSPRGMYFPFAADRESLIASEKFKRIANLDPMYGETILGLQPYRGGNEELRALHDLDIQDKHTALIVSQAVRDIEVRAECPPHSGPGRLQGLKLCDFTYAFPPGSPFAGMAVIPALQGLIRLVEDVLRIFEQLVDARRDCDSS